ncbi:hypothetical protein [Alkalihalobacillus deserti]|uniref:hypothetical protein n=1 Tax=Alkalihalobacillus deserti TaxID=2879466 RepID=UPI001D13AE98|nr:hypothetical protein [Alkalihalobacillus deserti]
MLRSLKVFALLLLIGFSISFLSGCTSPNSLPEEFEELRPSNPNQFYIIGFQKNNWELNDLQRALEQFIDDKDVLGITMFYKVTEENNVILEKYNYNLGSGFIVLENEGTPYLVSSYSEFERKKTEE